MGTNLGYLLKSSQLYFNMMAGFTDFVEKLYGSLFFLRDLFIIWLANQFKNNKS